MVTAMTATVASDVENDLTTATLDMCAHAFSTILKRLDPDFEPKQLGTLPATTGGVFVTWSILNERGDKYGLRGCIGTLKPTVINSAVDQYAAHAAFNDPRFSAITFDEVARLKVGVSILSKFEKADNAYDWTIGVHGIILEFGNGRYSATYLPEIARDLGWSRQTCLQSLAEKAGFRGKFEGAVAQNASVTRYQSTKAEMTYDEYLQLTA